MYWIKAILITAVAIVAPMLFVVTLGMIANRNATIEDYRKAYSQEYGRAESLSASLEDTREALQQTNDDVSDKTIAWRFAINDVARLEAEEERLQEVADELRVRVDAQTSLEELRVRKEELGGEVGELREEIMMLKAQRMPLLPHLHRVGLAGTGSMEPTLTGRDEVTLLTNWGNKVEDIPVGAIISFWPPPDCSSHPNPDNSVLHRVIKNHFDGIIRERVVYTKGDNAAPDNCRLVASDIEGYVVAIHKDANPDKA